VPIGRADWMRWLLSALALRLLVTCVLLGSLPLQSDALSYSMEGLRLLEDFPGRQAYFWPPGLSVLLAAAYAFFGGELWVAQALMTALGLLQVALVAALAHEVFERDPAAVRATAWIAVFYPAAVMINGQTYTQQLAAVCVTAVALALLRSRERPRVGPALWGGFALGFGCITRPSMLSVGLAVGALAAGWLLRAWARGERGLAAATAAAACAFGLIAAVPIVPVLLHNAARGAGYTISINNESNFLLGNNPYTPHYKTSHLGQRSLDELEPDARDYLAQFSGRPDARQAMVREAWRYIGEHPWITLWRTGNRIRAFWGFDYLMSRVIQREYGLGMTGVLIPLGFEAGGYLIVMLLALAALLCGPSASRSPAILLLLLIAVAYQAPYAVAFSSGTYHHPVMGLLFPLAGLALASWRDREGALARARRSRSFWAAAALLAALQLEYAYHTLMLA
jgi:hypothetical protein